MVISSSEEEAQVDPTKPFTAPCEAFFFGDNYVRAISEIEWPPATGPGREIHLRLSGGTTLPVPLAEVESFFFRREVRRGSNAALTLRTKVGGPLHKRLKYKGYDPSAGDLLLVAFPLGGDSAEEARRRLDGVPEEGAGAAAGGNGGGGGDSSSGGGDDGEEKGGDLVERTIASLDEPNQNRANRALNLHLPLSAASPRRRSTRLARPSPGRKEDDARLVLQYPPERTAQDPVVLTAGDAARLEPFEFLNDNLVDFALKHLVRERRALPLEGEAAGARSYDLDASRVDNLHVFTAHFYKKLTGPTGKAAAAKARKKQAAKGKKTAAAVAKKNTKKARTAVEEGSDRDDGDESGGGESGDSSGSGSEDEGERGSGDSRKRLRPQAGALAHANVERWTKDFDIFSKRWVAPLCGREHVRVAARPVVC